jgi:hypothetical protein
MSKQTRLSAAAKSDARLLTLLESRRWCYVIPFDTFVEGHGYRVSIAIEDEPGHRPTGTLGTISPIKAMRDAAFAAGGTVPWFWGMTLAAAEAACDDANDRLGYTKLEAAKIVASTMGKKLRP